MHLNKLRGDLDSSHLLDGSLLYSSDVATDSPEKTAPSPYDRSMLSKSMKEVCTCVSVCVCVCARVCVCAYIDG